jgi:tetratricopeptide (TPR) repeat protein
MMQDSNKTGSLLSRVQSRLRVASLSKSLCLWLVVTAAVAAVGTLAVRLGGILPPSQQNPQWLFFAPAVALLLTILFHRRSSRQAAARAVDQHSGSKDLFLTWSTLGHSAGEYQPLVEQEANDVSDRIRPVDVVPFRLGRPVLHVAGAAIVLAMIVVLFPQFDPMGTVEAAEKVEELKQEVTAIRQANKDRKEQLQKKTDINDEMSEQIDNEVDGLKSAFRDMKPKERKSNSKVLESHRSRLNEQWKMVSNDELRSLLSQHASAQQFGGTRTKQMNEWLKELQNGMTKSMEKKLDDARETLQAMMNAKTPEQRQKLASKLRRDLQDLKKFASDKAGSKELSAALDKALKALEAAAKKSGESNNDGMAEEAMQALQESLELSRSEMQELARSAKDLKKLEEAIKTLQQAQSLNQDGQLDGEQCEGCNSLSDYAELYKKLMAERGEPGEGMGNQGFGKGGEAPEDDSGPEGYKVEKSKSQVLAGKVLLSIKTKEYATDRDFDESELRQYQDNVTAIKTGVQAAIESEQVPPGYVEGIKGYFDKLENVDPKLSK